MSSDMREEVRASWAEIAPRWHEWRSRGDRASATVQLLAAARLEPGQRVLDLASGGGDPALDIAGLVLPGGHVWATDLVAEMIAPVRERARAQGLTNVECCIAAAEELPFGDQLFDRITCRFGVMFFSDLQQAMREAFRVLVPGGRVAFVVLGPRHTHQGIMSILEALAPYTAVPPPAADRPGMFRLGDPAPLLLALEHAGFTEIASTLHPFVETWQGSPEEYLERRDRFFAEPARLLSAEQRAAARAGALRALAALATDDVLRMQATAHVISACRPAMSARA